MPEAPDDKTEKEKFDELLDKLVQVPKDEVKREERKEKAKREYRED